MAQYAYFDHTAPQPARVIGWFDDVELNYPSPPAVEDRFVMTEEQWEARTTGNWAIDSGALVPYVAPVIPPTLAQQAYVLMLDGLTVTSTGTPALDATYPSDPDTQSKILGVEMVLSRSGAFPGGAASWPMRTSADVWVSMTSAQYTSVALAIADFVAQCFLVIDGQSESLPAAAVTIG